MKLSVQLICTFLMTVLLSLPLEAKNILSHNKPLDDCLPPGAAVIIDITSISARLTWTAPVGATGLNYEWEIGAPGFTPGEDGLLSGSVMDTTDLVVGLGAQTLFEVYVRSSCDGLVFSDWVGPVTFSTSPGCGDLFLDSGGILGDYQNDEKTVTTICPDIAAPPTVVKLAFTQFVLADGDVMQVFNGTSINDVLIGKYTQANTAPFTVTATNPSGCLTVQFTSDMEKIEDGWTALITCIEPEECFPVDEINVFNLQATVANFSWPAVFGAFGYEWEILNLQNTVVQTGSTTNVALNVTGLLEATNYTFRVRTLCPLLGESAWRTIAFYTPINCASKPEIHCGEIRSSSTTGQGIWQTNACSYATPGQEKLFRFTAPHTRMYTFQTVSGSSAGNAYVTYAYKEVTAGCGPFDWQCIGSFNVSFNNTETVFGPLTAGKEYLILLDAETTAPLTHSFRIKDCGPPNDEAPGALTLAVNTPCVGNIYSNTAATFNHDELLGQEPDPDAEVGGTDELSGRWLTAADETVWFKFKAPPSGSVIVSTESLPQGGNFDTQLAMYETPDSSQYKLFKLIVSDDDNGDFGLGYNSVFSYSGLTPGRTYYIQVDGYGIAIGNFCIEITEGVIRLNEAECAPGYFVENVDGTAPDGDHWYDVYSRPDELDLGDLLVAVKPGNQNLDTVFCQISVADTVPVSANHVPYLPAYYNIHTSKAPSVPFLVRLFFHQSEFDSLVIKSGLEPGDASIDQLVATHYAGPNEDCFQLNNSYQDPGPGTGIPTLITALKAVNMPASKMFYVEFEMFAEGEVGVHLQQTVLPLELKSFTGKIVDRVNRLEWTTQTEKNVAWHLVERSADGINWAVVERQNGQVNALFPTNYTFDDIRPLPKSYYRLRSVDFDGLSVLSNIVVLTRQEAGLGIDRVFPSPTQDRLNIEYSTPEETDLVIRVSDLTGQIVLEEQITAAKGRHNTNLSLLSLPAGMYIVTLSDGISVVTPVRVVKK